MQLFELLNKHGRGLRAGAHAARGAGTTRICVARGMVHDIDHPEYGKLVVMRSPIHYGGVKQPDYRPSRDTVRRFMVNEVKPVEDKLPHDAVSCSEEDRKILQAKAKKLGLWMMRTPAEYGGAGLNLLGQRIVAEEAAKCRMGAYIPGMGRLRCGPAERDLGRHSGADRKIRPARRINEGKKDFVAISEASGGADPARAIKTQAVLKGDRYILNGSKMWITGAEGRDWGIVYARTGHGGRGGITSFIVDGRCKGLSTKVIPGHSCLRALRSASSTTSRCRSRTASARKAAASSSPRSGWSKAACPTQPARYRHRAGGARPRHRVGQAARGIRLAPVGQAGDPVDARRQRDGIARGALADLRGRMEGRSRPGHQDRSIDRQGHGDGDGGPRGRPLHPDLRRPRRVEGCRWSAGIANCASSASAKARRKSNAWLWRVIFSSKPGVRVHVDRS
jgi:hypothetical protein